MRVEPDGKVRLAVGLHSHGQGQETTMAQIAADQLGLEVEDMHVVFGDTGQVPYGFGSYSSRATIYCGGATILAAKDIVAKARTIAAHMLEANPDDLELGVGKFSVRGNPTRSGWPGRTSPSSPTTGRRSCRREWIRDSTRSASTWRRSGDRSPTRCTSWRWRWTSRPAT